jgi:hypothetical protein
VIAKESAMMLTQGGFNASQEKLKIQKYNHAQVNPIIIRGDSNVHPCNLVFVKQEFK